MLRRHLRLERRTFLLRTVSAYGAGRDLRTLVAELAAREGSPIDGHFVRRDPAFLDCVPLTLRHVPSTLHLHGLACGESLK